MLDSFQHIGPNGAHVCLVFELMGETLASFGGWFRGGRIPYALMRRFTIQLVRALDYAHTHGVIHTGKDACLDYLLLLLEQSLILTLH